MVEILDNLDITMIPSHNFILKDIKKLYSEPSSHIKKESAEILLLLHPIYMGDIKSGIKNELNSLIKTYMENVSGIVMGYENVKVISSSGWNFDTNPFLHINIKADFYVFSPSVGSILKGVVVKKSPNHVGCLVHNIFNATSYVPYGVLRNDWCGSRVNESQTIELKITEIDMKSVVPNFVGEIVENSVPSVLETSLNDYDSGISSIDKSLDEDIKKKKRKKKEYTSAKNSEELIDNSVDSTDYGKDSVGNKSALQETLITKKHKKDKKKSKKEDSDNTDFIYEEKRERKMKTNDYEPVLSEDNDLNSKKYAHTIKKSHKRSHSQIEETPEKLSQKKKIRLETKYL